MDLIREKRSLFFPQSCQGKKDTRENWVTSHSLIWIPFISFYYLIAVAKTSNTMLNRSGQSGHSCFAPDFSRKASNFSPLNIMLAVVHYIY